MLIVKAKTPARGREDRQARILQNIGLVLLLLALGFWLQGAYIFVKAELGQYLIKRAWQHSLLTGAEHKPWLWADTWPVARIQVPSRDINQVVLAGDSGQALAFGPGHTSSSAQPGADGVVVISGHRDTHFGFLQNLREGEAIILQNWEGQHTVYRVSGRQVVDEDVLIASNNNTRSLILVTCWPFDSSAPNSRHRYIVHAQAVDASI